MGLYYSDVVRGWFEEALVSPEFGVSEKRTERKDSKKNRQSITISPLRFENLTKSLYYILPLGSSNLYH